MGVKNLNTLIEKLSPNGKIKKHLSEFSGQTFAIDTNVYLYKYLYGKSNHIDGMFFMVNKFKKFNINPLFIFDGKPPNEKINTIANRRENKQKLHERIMDLKAHLNLNELDNIDEISSIEKRIVFVNYDIIQSTKELLKYMGIPFIDADTEAEHYCAKLNKLGIANAVVSEDMDTLACGSSIVLRNFTNRDDMIDVYYLQSILNDLNISYNSFIDMCILLGNDYIPRIRGYTPDEIYDDIINYVTIENIINNKSIKIIGDIHRMREIYKTDNIDIDINEFNYKTKTMRNLIDLIKFLRENSTIEISTIKHRLDKMYNPISNISSNRTLGCWR